MGIVNTITAIFNFHGQKMQMEVLSARIKKGIARLRSLDGSQEYEIRANHITITIDNEEDDSVRVVEPTNHDEPTDDETDDPTNANEKHESQKNGTKGQKRPATAADFTIEKKSFATGFYEPERLEIVNAYKSAKAKRDEYLLACVRAASPRKVEQELRRIRKERESMQEPDKEEQ